MMSKQSEEHSDNLQQATPQTALVKTKTQPGASADTQKTLTARPRALRGLRPWQKWVIRLGLPNVCPVTSPPVSASV